MATTPTHCGPIATHIQANQGNCAQILIDGNGSESSPYTLTPMLTLESGCIVCGPNGLDVCISSNSHNYLSKDETGCLFVSPPVFSNPDTCPAGPCIDITVSGSGCVGDEFVITASPVLDQNQANLLSCGIDGLLAVVGLVGIQTTTAQTNVSGNGGPTSPFIVSTDVKIDPNPTNAIVVTTEGLYVQHSGGAFETHIQVLDAFDQYLFDADLIS